MKKTILKCLMMACCLIWTTVSYGQVISEVAGTTTTVMPNDGDLFSDPGDGTNGGPGGDCSTTSSGDLGDYPNCNCITVTTLTAPAGGQVSVTFNSFRVFGNFDWLTIFDGSGAVTATNGNGSATNPTSGDTELWNSSVDGDELIDMTNAGMVTFTSTNGSLTFASRFSGVVNTCGWEADVAVTGGTPPPPPVDCTEFYESPTNSPTIVNGYSILSAGADRTVMDDFTVDPGDEWDLSEVTVVTTEAAGGIAPAFNVSIREDNAGSPGAVISSEMISSASVVDNDGIIATSFGFNWHSYTIPLSAFVNLMPGTYWVELGTDIASGNVFWEAINQDAVVGSESWVDYSDFNGLEPASSIFGVQADQAFTLCAFPVVEGCNLTCPADIAVPCEDGSDPSVTGFATTGSDCTVVFEDEVIGCAITRTWIATAPSGEITTCVQSITLIDDSAPAIVCPPSQSLTCFETIPEPVTTAADFIAAGGTISDNCTGDLADFSIFSQDSNNGGDNCPANATVVTR
ncbi:MAG: hypothetical protein AB8F74_23545, partial [Saprospiraceae bacterium]